MSKINWKSAGLTLAGFAVMVLSKIIDDKSRSNELAEMKEEITRDVTENLSNQLKES